jgi:hypothetical protein
MNTLFGVPERASLPLSEVIGKFKVYVSDSVKLAIQTLHHNIVGLEWSGYISYKCIGDFYDEDFAVSVEHLHLMDIGTAGGTEWDENTKDSAGLHSSIVTFPYRMDGYYHGIIHTHHTMATFFSTQADVPNFLKGCMVDFLHLSLITNYQGHTIAQIGQCVDIQGNSTKDGEVVKYNFGGKRILYKECTVDMNWNADPVLLAKIVDIRLVKSKAKAEAAAKEKENAKSWGTHYKQPATSNAVTTLPALISTPKIDKMVCNYLGFDKIKDIRYESVVTEQFSKSDIKHLVTKVKQGVTMDLKVAKDKAAMIALLDDVIMFLGTFQDPLSIALYDVIDVIVEEHAAKLDKPKIVLPHYDYKADELYDF